MPRHSTPHRIGAALATHQTKPKNGANHEVREKFVKYNIHVLSVSVSVLEKWNSKKKETKEKPRQLLRVTKRKHFPLHAIVPRITNNVRL